VKIFFKLFWNLLASIAIAGAIFFIGFLFSELGIISVEIGKGLYIGGFLLAFTFFIARLYRLIAEENKESN